MGLLDQITGAASGMLGQQGEGQSSPLNAIMQLLNNPQSGGMAGLIQSFEQAGLGDTVKSWLSNGENHAVSAAQVESALGSEQIQNFASQLGIAPEQASGKLAEYLPQVIDQLTPDGKLPETGDLATRGLELLKGKLFG